MNRYLLGGLLSTVMLLTVGSGMANSVLQAFRGSTTSQTTNGDSFSASASAPISVQEAGRLVQRQSQPSPEGTTRSSNTVPPAQSLPPTTRQPTTTVPNNQVSQVPSEQRYINDPNLVRVDQYGRPINQPGINGNAVVRPDRRPAPIDQEALDAIPALW